MFNMVLVTRRQHLPQQSDYAYSHPNDAYGSGIRNYSSRENLKKPQNKPAKYQAEQGDIFYHKYVKAKSGGLQILFKKKFLSIILRKSKCEQV